ncbi:hypothetical protein MBANPS3_011724 [Mucor bainieri]
MTPAKLLRRSALGKHFKRSAKGEHGKSSSNNRNIAEIVKTIFANYANLPLNQALKNAKKEIREDLGAETRVMTKRVIKALKVYIVSFSATIGMERSKPAFIRRKQALAE